jgi:protein SCO1/2
MIDYLMNNRPKWMCVRMLVVLFALVLTLLSVSAFSAENIAQEGIPHIGRNIRVEDQQGRELSFFRDLIKGRIVAINFIFTRCTSSCPLSSAIFHEVQQKLGPRPVAQISITVDPSTDTPERLRAYAKNFHAGPNWHFVTGEQATITQLLKALGVSSTDKNSHTNMVLIGNEATGRWRRLYGLPNVDDILAALDDAH